MLAAIEKYSDRALDASLALIMLIITVLTLAQVIWRYTVGTSFTWSEELNLLLWAWMIALAAIKAQHLRISMLVSLLPHKAQMVLYLLRWLLTMGLLGVLFYFGMGMVQLTASDRYTELDFISRKWLFMSITVCVIPWAAVATVRMIRALKDLANGHDPMDKAISS